MLLRLPWRKFRIKIHTEPTESFRNLYPHQTVSFRSNPKLVVNPINPRPIQKQSELVIRINQN